MVVKFLGGRIMGVIFKVRKGNYVFDFLYFFGAPLPTARIDENGNEIPMTVEEIDAWRENYLKSNKGTSDLHDDEMG